MQTIKNSDQFFNTAEGCNEMIMKSISEIGQEMSHQDQLDILNDLVELRYFLLDRIITVNRITTGSNPIRSNPGSQEDIDLRFQTIYLIEKNLGTLNAIGAIRLDYFHT